ncbi:MAG TPA: hypothetical protein VK914_07350, partial [bacterium]|nr:hypothetical protein [bacterium]
MARHAIQTLFLMAGLALASLACPPHALALGGSGVSSCVGPAPTPVASESLTQYQTITGVGLNYSMVESTAGDNFTVSLPAGAVIVQAYFWEVEDEATTTTAAVVTTATFNGTGVTAQQATTSFLWENLFYTNLRFDVSSLVSATGSSYSWSSNSVSSLGLPQAGYLAIVYQLASDASVTTLVFADGMNVWHDNETTEDGPGPEPVGLDWSCAGNPVCNSNDVSFSRAGGNIYDVDDGDVVDGKYADEILNPPGGPVLWRGPTGQLPVCGAEPCPQVSTYTPGSPAFTPGQDSTMYDLYDNSTYASKDTVFLASLVLMNKCPKPQSPTPTPNWTATPAPTPIPTSCGPPPSLYAPGTKEVAGLGSNSPFSTTVSGPATLPLNPLLLVRIYVGGSSYPAPAALLSSVSYGGTPLTRWAAGVNQIATMGTVPDTDFETWYLSGAIPAGNQTLTLSWAGGTFKYPIEVVAEFFQGVDQSAPLGAAGAGDPQAGGSTYLSSLTTTKANSMVSTLLDDGESSAEYAGCEAVNSSGTTEFPTVLGSFDTNGAEADGPANSIGATSVLWALPSCTSFHWTSESVELIGAPCPPPTPTKTVTLTGTMTDTPTQTPSVTVTPSYSDTASPTDTFSASPTRTDTPSPTDTSSASPTR